MPKKRSSKAKARPSKKRISGLETGQKTERELIAILRQKAQPYLRWPNITSIGLGYKVINGEETDQLAFQYTVTRKLTPTELVEEDLPMLPPSIVADDGTEIPTDVLERSYRASYTVIGDPMTERAAATPDIRQIRRSRLDPLRPGVSVGRLSGRTGTIGGVVYDAKDGTPYLLSNWHVLCGPDGVDGNILVQPSAHDDPNRAQNVLGTLVRNHLGLAGDCAIGKIEGRVIDERILELDLVPRRVGVASLNDKVVKSGRTTGVTFGVVKRVGLVTKMNYGAGFENQEIGGFEIGPNPKKPPVNGEISDLADSGSLWLVDTDGPDKDVVLGLHFGGELDPDPAAEHALACNIHSVLEKLRVTFIKP